MRATSRYLTAIVTIALVAACGGDDADTTDGGDALGDGPTATAAAETELASLPAFGLVSTASAADLAGDERVTVIDVRTPEEYDAGHLGEVDQLIDFYADGFADEIAGLDRDGRYLIYCRSGNRSGQTAALMAQLGFEQVWDLDGGVNAWSADGLALVGP